MPNILSVGEILAAYEENTRDFLFPANKHNRGQQGSIREVLMKKTYGFTTSTLFRAGLMAATVLTLWMVAAILFLGNASAEAEEPSSQAGTSSRSRTICQHTQASSSQETPQVPVDSVAQARVATSKKHACTSILSCDDVDDEEEGQAEAFGSGSDSGEGQVSEEEGVEDASDATPASTCLFKLEDFSMLLRKTSRALGIVLPADTAPPQDSDLPWGIAPKMKFYTTCVISESLLSSEEAQKQDNLDCQHHEPTDGMLQARSPKKNTTSPGKIRNFLPTKSYEQPTIASVSRSPSPYTRRRMCELLQVRQRLAHLDLGPFDFRKETDRPPFVIRRVEQWTPSPDIHTWLRPRENIKDETTYDPTLLGSYRPKNVKVSTVKENARLEATDTTEGDLDLDGDRDRENSRQARCLEGGCLCGDAEGDRDRGQRRDGERWRCWTVILGGDGDSLLR
ncbi:hypothetical protein JD844_018021 [Phrynosoma platyrhinos]|uniref:Spermatogenesis-associated protein 6 N-terminal domain-containing protein n=1 Tax=Phrynosoma platyrhinos TaxID=52577 RepID=A0ABQ7SMU7_PHRPL|nr:hypothetical protein JD844_018021 [Phrynosoma platyrhinos]